MPHPVNPVSTPERRTEQDIDYDKFAADIQEVFARSAPHALDPHQTQLPDDRALAVQGIGAAQRSRQAQRPTTTPRADRHTPIVAASVQAGPSTSSVQGRHVPLAEIELPDASSQELADNTEARILRDYYAMLLRNGAQVRIGAVDTLTAGSHDGTNNLPDESEFREWLERQEGVRRRLDPHFAGLDPFVANGLGGRQVAHREEFDVAADGVYASSLTAQPMGTSVPAEGRANRQPLSVGSGFLTAVDEVRTLDTNPERARTIPDEVDARDASLSGLTLATARTPDERIGVLRYAKRQVLNTLGWLFVEGNSPETLDTIGVTLDNRLDRDFLDFLGRVRAAARGSLQARLGNGDTLRGTKLYFRLDQAVYQRFGRTVNDLIDLIARCTADVQLYSNPHAVAADLYEGLENLGFEEYLNQSTSQPQRPLNELQMRHRAYTEQNRQWLVDHALSLRNRIGSVVAAVRDAFAAPAEPAVARAIGTPHQARSATAMPSRRHLKPNPRQRQVPAMSQVTFADRVRAQGLTPFKDRWANPQQSRPADPELTRYPRNGSRG